MLFSSSLVYATVIRWNYLLPILLKRKIPYSPATSQKWEAFYVALLYTLISDTANW